ncbi:MAG: FkbM family methyltransferase [Geobacteraceae bacterium]|nr:FkbM family methyltransferase [Geobacteraceae bacterium]
MAEKLFKFILLIHRKLFIGKRFYKFNKLLFDLSLRGLGILNFENSRVSGEDYLFQTVLAEGKNLLVMDVGANQGDYSTTLRKYCPDATIYAFEPHPATFQLLLEEAARHNFRAFNLGFSDVAGKMQLFDRHAEKDGTQHASLYREVIEDIHQAKVLTVDVTISTIDAFVAEQGIPRIHLLKVDTEGNELNVLRGAEQALASNMIDMVQIEFNEMNTISRVFFKDFYLLLHNYDCYRLLPDGLLPIKKYRPLHCELFAFQNVLFVRRDLQFNDGGKVRALT